MSKLNLLRGVFVVIIIVIIIIIFVVPIPQPGPECPQCGKLALGRNLDYVAGALAVAGLVLSMGIKEASGALRQ